MLAERAQRVRFVAVLDGGGRPALSACDVTNVASESIIARSSALVVWPGGGGASEVPGGVPAASCLTRFGYGFFRLSVSSPRTVISRDSVASRPPGHIDWALPG